MDVKIGQLCTILGKIKYVYFIISFDKFYHVIYTNYDNFFRGEFMDMYVNIILLIVLGFFAFFGFIFGLARGLWKTMFRTVWLVLTVVAAVMLAPIVTNAILDFPVNASITIEELNITTITTVRDAIHIALDNLIMPTLTVDYPGLTEIIISIPTMVLNIVLFILIFFILKIILLPLSAIVYHIFTGSKKEKNTTMAKANVKDKKTRTKTVSAPVKTKPIKKSKHRFVGAIVGLSTGVVVSFSLLMPVAALTNLVEKHKLASTLDGFTESTIVTDYVTAYNNSIVGQIYKYTGLGMVADLTFDTLTSVKIDNTHTIKLTTDLPLAIEVYSKLDGLMVKINSYMGPTLDYNALTKAQVTELIADAATLLEDLESITTLASINDYIIPIMLDYLEYKDIQLNADAELNEALYNTLNSLGNAVASGTNINVFSELNSLLDIASFINDKDLLLPLLQMNQDALTNKLLELDDDFATELSNKLFALQTVNVTAPNLVNTGLIALSKSFGIVYEGDHLVSSTEIKNTLASIINGVLDVYATLDFSNPTFLTEDTLASVGRLLDTVKGSAIMDTDTYNSVVEFGVGFMSSMLSSMIPESLEGTFGAIMEVLPDNIANVTSWETELTIMQEVIEMLGSENGLLHEGYDNKNKDHFTYVGTTLDKLATTKLFGSKVPLAYVEDGTNKNTYKTFIEYILFEALDELKPMLSENIDESFAEILDVFDDVKLNIANSTYNPATDTNYWENEFACMADTMNLLLSTMTTGDITIDGNTGKTLDNLKKSNLFGTDTTAKVFIKVANMVKEELDFGDDEITEIIVDTIDNITSRLETTSVKQLMKNDAKFWETEMTHLSSLLDIDLSSNDALDDLSYTGATIDNIVFGNLPTIRESVLLDAMDFRKIIATTIESMKDTILDGLTSGTAAYTAVDNAITSIVKNYYDSENNTHNAVTITSFEDELAHIVSLKDVDPNVFSHTNSSKAYNLGQTLDNIAYNTNANNNSETITKDIINKIIVDCLPMISSNTGYTYIDTAIGEIKTNINAVYTGTKHILNWKTELVHLYNVANLENNMFDDFDDFTNAKATTVGNIIDGVVYNYSNSTKDTNKNSTIITENIINTLVSSLIESVKYPSSTTNETEKLTNKILTNAASNAIIEYTTNEADSYTYTEVFQELAYIKEQVNGISGILNTPAISSLTESTATKIDQTLANCQATKVCGSKIAKETALHIITTISTETYRTYANYAKAVFNYYTANASTSDMVVFYDESDSSTYTDTTNLKNAFLKVYNEYTVLHP